MLVQLCGAAFDSLCAQIVRRSEDVFMSIVKESNEQKKRYEIKDGPDGACNMRMYLITLLRPRSNEERMF